MVFKTHSTIRCDNTPMAYQTFTHQIWWVMVCYDLAHQIRWTKHTFSGRCDITPVCCSFGGHSTPQFLQCMQNVNARVQTRSRQQLISCANEESASVPLSDAEQSESVPADVDMETRVACQSNVEVVETGTQTTDGEYKHKKDEMERELQLLCKSKDDIFKEMKGRIEKVSFSMEYLNANEEKLKFYTGK